MPDDFTFARIISGEAPATIVYQDDLVTAFHDIHPQAPVHILIVPNRLIATVNDVMPEDEKRRWAASSPLPRALPPRGALQRVAIC